MTSRTPFSHEAGPEVQAAVGQTPSGLFASLSELKVSNSFASLPSDFYTFVQPEKLENPRLLHANTEVARQLGLAKSVLASSQFLEVMAGSQPLPGGKALAAVYSGHQFGIWAGQLGDGRAHLLGEVNTAEGPLEIQLKGSGLTPYSRMGDGRAVVRSTVREYLASEAMAGLGIATTRALALVVADTPVQRETLEKAAVVARVAPSFIRFGSFEHWAEHPQNMKALLQYVVKRFYPQCQQVDNTPQATASMALCLLAEVAARSAKMVADWQTVGFCHGVMNTDNMSILGLTIDYGPYGFIDGFQIDHVCNRSDHQGRYAWNAQPAIVQWNLQRLGLSFMCLGVTPEQLQDTLQPFGQQFLDCYHDNLVQKFGWKAWRINDEALVDDWWHLLHSQAADLTLAFRLLAEALHQPEAWLALFSNPQPAREWLERYRQRVALDGQDDKARITQMHSANPVYVLRNHLAQAAIEGAEQGDPSEIDTLIQLLRQPYTPRAGFEAYASPAPEWASSLAVSCSS